MFLHYFSKSPLFAFSSFYNNLQLHCANSFKHSELKVTQKHTDRMSKLNVDSLVFGSEPTDHMVSILSKQGKWGIPEIRPFANLAIHPFNSTLHYAVQCYQGLKAYKNQKGEIRIFRPDCNMFRFKHSSTRIVLPDFDGAELRKIIEQYVKLQNKWIPAKSGYSLYIRPYHISRENSLGVKSPHASQILVVASPVGPYYPTGFKPISITCSHTNIRSAPKGTGGYKIGGNYGPTIIVANEALKKGYQQVLYLCDGKIGEVGTSNIFFVFKDPKTKQVQIVTPELEDLVLPGVTRDTIIEYLRYKNYKVTERQIDVDELIKRHEKGQLVECFCSGTAVIVSPVKMIQNLGKQCAIPVNEEYQSGEITYMVWKDLLDIQEGRAKDSFGWSVIVNK